MNNAIRLAPTFNPYDGMHPEDIQCEIDAIDRFKEQVEALVAELHSQRLHGVDVGEFSAHFDDAFGDTIGASRNLAERAMEDQR